MDIQESVGLLELTFESQLVLPALINRTQQSHLLAHIVRRLRLRGDASEKPVTAICCYAQAARKIHDAVSVFDTRDDLVLLCEKFNSIAADRRLMNDRNHKIEYFHKTVCRNRQTIYKLQALEPQGRISSKPRKRNSFFQEV